MTGWESRLGVVAWVQSEPMGSAIEDQVTARSFRLSAPVDRWKNWQRLSWEGRQSEDAELATSKRSTGVNESWGRFCARD